MDNPTIFINTNNLSNESNLLKLKAKLRLLDVVIREVIKTINNVEREAENGENSN